MSLMLGALPDEANRESEAMAIMIPAIQEAGRTVTKTRYSHAQTDY